MGSSQSKKDFYMSVEQGRVLEQESILSAIAANKRERKLLLKQAKRVKKSNMYSTSKSHLHHERQHQLQLQQELQQQQQQMQLRRHKSKQIVAANCAPTEETYYIHQSRNHGNGREDGVNIYRRGGAQRRNNQSVSLDTTNGSIAPNALALASRQLSRETLLISCNENCCSQRYQQHKHYQYNNFPVGSQSSTSQYSSQSSSSIYMTLPDNQYHCQQSHQHQSSNNNNLKSNKPKQNQYIDSLNHRNQHLFNKKKMFIQPRFQRGLAFNEEERKQYGLVGLLPAAIQKQDLQIKGVMNFIENCKDELSQYVYLRNLKDFNERLFYAALTQNVEKLMPLVYTPTVGLACQKFSQIYMRPRGLFITSNDHGRIASILSNWPEKDVRVIVVTDGERILGLGDMGTNGMGISIGKLSLYTALAGIPPENVLPVTIDVGTNNEDNLKDPFYIGLRINRVRGEKYDALIDEFMQSVVNRWGNSCLIQFEDFANATAFTLLQRYRNNYCTFNDDIQGTASVCISGLISAAKLIQRRLSDCSFLFYGAGEANLGTANLLIMAMNEEGVHSDDAKRRIFLVDSKGLVVKSRQDLSLHKQPFAQDAPQMKELEEIVAFVKPSAIIGASAQTGAFSESICKTMAEFNERPIIFALSNPTSKAECTADQAYNWTSGKCVFASGSPFEPVIYKGKTYITGQGNNAYIFPAVGLAAIAAHVHNIPEDTFLVAAKALSDRLTESDTSLGLVYPRLSKIREVTLKVATRVFEHFYTERLATYRPEPGDKLNFLKSIQYDCRYKAETLSLDQMSLSNNIEENVN